MGHDVILDTNVLLNGVDLSVYNTIFLPVTVLEELDKIKHTSEGEKNYKARKAIKSIENADNIQYIFEYASSLPHWLDLSIPDNRTLAYTLKVLEINKDAIILSGDINVLAKCKALGIGYEKFDGNTVEEELYKGYKTLEGGTYFINELFDNINHGINEHGFVTNEYLILYNSDIDEIYEYRFDGNKFVDLKLPNSKIIKGTNSLQRCALDLLNNKDIPICAINGAVGSGKTYMSIRMALHHVTDKGYGSKVLAVREALGEGKEIGYLRGTFEDKTKMFFKPIEQSLTGGEFELQSLIQRGTLESNIPFFMKGTTYNDTIIVVDEAEDLSKKQIKLIGTRLGHNSRIFFAGDYQQSSIDSSRNNALVRMCNEMKGNKKFGCIYLDEDVRSEASKIFAELFIK
jgi:predicted ribonuclease YlaK